MFSSNSCTLYLFKCIAQYLVQVEEIWILSDKAFAITGLTQCQNINSYNTHTMSICNKLFSFSIHVVEGESCLGRNQNIKQLTHILHCTVMQNTCYAKLTWKNSALFNIIGITFYDSEHVAWYKPFVTQQLQKMPLGGKQKLQHGQWI